MTIPGDWIDRALTGGVVLGALILLTVRVVPPPSGRSEAADARPMAMARVAAPPPRADPPGAQSDIPSPLTAAAEIGDQRMGAMETAAATAVPTLGRAVAEAADADLSTTPAPSSVELGVQDLDGERLDLLAAEIARGEERWPAARAPFSVAAARRAIRAIGGRVMIVSDRDPSLRYELVGGLDPEAVRAPGPGGQLLFPIPDAPASLREFTRARWPAGYGRPVLAWEPPRTASDRTLAVVATVLHASGLSRDSVAAVVGEWRETEDDFRFVPTAIDHVRGDRTPVNVRGGS